MYKTILIPLDGSKRAEAILPHAEELAMHYDAELILMQVVEPATMNVRPEGPYSMGDQGEQFAQRVRQAQSYLTGLQGEFREKSIQARIHVVTGPVVETIINVAESEGVDLIAMASHGRGGLARVFYGSVAAGVLQRVDRPLLLVRARGDR